ncbi:MAG: (Fe-S)-binding protein [Bacillota bacterium]
MSVYDSLERVREDIITCMKCGNCQAVCPIYKEDFREASVARGKIMLADALLKGELDYTPEVAQRFELCLTCKACVGNCPCGVQVDRIILAARAERVRRRGLPWPKGIVFRGLKQPGLFNKVVGLGRRLQGLVLAPVGEGICRPRFPMGLDSRRIVPPLATVSLKDRVSPVTKVEKPLLRVGFYAGCLTNFVYPDIGLSVIRVLTANNIEVHLLSGQHCCGVPVLMHGDVGTAKEMALSHVGMFFAAKLDALVTACPTCGCAWKHYYPDLLANFSSASKAKDLAAITLDINEFLVKRTGMPAPGSGHVLRKLTYHDPCHLARGQGVRKEPREVLQRLAGAQLVEMALSDRCCGGAGSFSLTHYDIASKIVNRKTERIAASGADLVVTACPGCRMHLTDGLRQKGISQRVLHTVEVLDEAYQASKQQANAG